MTTDGGAAEGNHYPVFISFARPNGLRAAIALRKELRKFEIAAFVDQRDSSPVKPWEPTVSEALEKARIAVVVLTERSQQQHVDPSLDQFTEIRRALEFHKHDKDAYGIYVWLRRDAPPKLKWPMGLENFTGHTSSAPQVAKALADCLQAMPARTVQTSDSSRNDTPRDPAGVPSDTNPNKKPKVARGQSTARPVPTPAQQQLSDEAKAARADAERKINAALNGRATAERALAQAASIVLDAALALPARLVPLVQYILDEDASKMWDTLRQSVKVVPQEDRPFLFKCGMARAELDAESSAVLAPVRQLIAAPAGDRKLKVRSMRKPASIGLVNARAHGVSAPMSMADIRKGREPIVEGTHVWDRDVDLPVLASIESVRLKLGERFGGDLGAFRQPSKLTGRSLVERIVAADGGAQLHNVNELIEECRLILAAGRSTGIDLFKRTIIVVDIGGYDDVDDATIAFEQAAEAVLLAFQNCAPPVFFLLGDEAGGVERAVNRAMRELLSKTSS